MSTMNLFDIDPNRLDQELYDQPNNYYNTAKAVTAARLEVERQKCRVEVYKEQMKTTDAEILIACRRNPALFGLDKATDSTVDAAVQASKEHLTAFQNYMAEKALLSDKEYSLGLLEAALGAMDNKKMALSKGVELHVHNYRSAPRTTERGTFEPSGRRLQE